MSSTDRTSLGDRMKLHEQATRPVLPPRTPVILRVDGKAFHTFTRKAKKPFDDTLIDLMNETAKHLCKGIQGAQMAYVQSDEISVLIHGYKKYSSTPWFDNAVQKMTSVGASMATAALNCQLFDEGGHRFLEFSPPVYFDGRVFAMPEGDVNNYFLWRQQDCTRNSVQMVARSIFSHKECNNKNGQQLAEMCKQSGVDYEAVPVKYRRGRVIYKETYPMTDGSGSTRTRWAVDENIPVFSEDKNYVEKYLQVEDE